MMFQFDVDPASIHLNLDFDLRSAIHESIKVASVASLVNKKPYLLFYEELNGEPNYKVLSREWDQYNKGEFTCPQDADLEHLKQHKKPRPVPSALCLPTKVVVAKPDLCETCVHRLSRAVKGYCKGLVYEPL